MLNQELLNNISNYLYYRESLKIKGYKTRINFKTDIPPIEFLDQFFNLSIISIDKIEYISSYNYFVLERKNVLIKKLIIDEDKLFELDDLLNNIIFSNGNLNLL